jgi:hypothetical protein
MSYSYGEACCAQENNSRYIRRAVCGLSSGSRDDERQATKKFAQVTTKGYGYGIASSASESKRSGYETSSGWLVQGYGNIASGYGKTVQAQGSSQGIVTENPHSSGKKFLLSNRTPLPHSVDVA